MSEIPSQLTIEDIFRKQKILSEEFLLNLPTPRLLKYYRKIYARYEQWIKSWRCDCCNEIIFYRYSTEDKYKAEKVVVEAYVNLVKSILDKREHVDRPAIKPFRFPLVMQKRK